MKGWTPPWQSLACGSYFFFSLRSFSAWVPSLAGTMGSCRPSSESVSSTTRMEETEYQLGPLLLLPRPGTGLESRPAGGASAQESPRARGDHPFFLEPPHNIPTTRRSHSGIRWAALSPKSLPLGASALEVFSSQMVRSCSTLTAAES